jgi:hypothetical protein
MTLSVIFTRGASSRDICSLQMNLCSVPVSVTDNFLFGDMSVSTFTTDDLLSVGKVVWLSDSAMVVPDDVLLFTLSATFVGEIRGSSTWGKKKKVLRLSRARTHTYSLTYT